MLRRSSELESFSSTGILQLCSLSMNRDFICHKSDAHNQEGNVLRIFHICRICSVAKLLAQDIFHKPLFHHKHLSFICYDVKSIFKFIAIGGCPGPSVPQCNGRNDNEYSRYKQNYETTTKTV